MPQKTFSRRVSTSLIGRSSGMQATKSRPALPGKNKVSMPSSVVQPRCAIVRSAASASRVTCGSSYWAPSSQPSRSRLSPQAATTHSGPKAPVPVPSLNSRVHSTPSTGCPTSSAAWARMP